jgi:acyl-coenzyme A thioesterase PaaI-like protein
MDTDLVAIGRTLRAGKTIGAVDVEVKDNAGRIVAVGRGTYSTLLPTPRA